MSGKISEVRELENRNTYEIEVSFIDPNYFQSKAVVGSKVTIQEASKILCEGKVTMIG